MVVVHSGAYLSRIGRCRTQIGRLGSATRRGRAEPPSPRGLRASRIYAQRSGRLFSRGLSSPYLSSLPLVLVLSSSSPTPRNRGDLSFPLPLDSPIPLTSSLARSSVRKQSLSGVAQRERSLGRDMNSRSSFYIPRSPALHFACSSPLSTSPICDYRMCRPHSYLIGPTLSLSLPLAFSVCICA